MVDEKDDRYEGQEEEEYHFSDDQTNYDVDADIPKASTAGSGSLASKFAQKREIMLGTVALVVLVFFVYKMVMPESAPPPFELAQDTSSVKKPAATPHAAEKTTDKAADKNAVHPSMDALATLSQPTPAPSSAPTPVAPQVPTPTAPMVASQPSMPTLPAAPVETSPPAVDTSQVKKILDRVGAVEQQNSAVMNVLQTEYAQKLADYETQNTALRGKVTELTKRLNDIDTNLAQLTQLLTGVANKISSSAPAATTATTTETSAPTASSAALVVQQPPATKSEPKIAYIVQAIIPGRAWLKADTGDTVTVAEGDVLKDYGRITKIDPYDGIVEIDTGNKMITLSYGVGGG
jgi:hypothetical protein